MRVARLHGIRDMRVERIPVPVPGDDDLLVRVEACGVCATDSRKYEIGVNDGEYPFNPGHEWLGTVASVGRSVKGWKAGDRVYGDVYGGYADYCLIPSTAIPWSRGPLRLPADLPAERAIFVEPLADCIHAVHDQAKIKPGEKLVVIAAGVMGLKIVAEAAQSGVDVLVVEPLADRARLAKAFGARDVVGPQGWSEAAKSWSGGGVDAVILTIGNPDLVDACIQIAAPGGRVVLFAGFGDRSKATIDVNRLHYKEIVLTGSEWIGTPPNQVRARYDEALDRLIENRVGYEQLVTARCGFEDLEAAIVRRQSFQGLKTMFLPGEDRGS
jgi:threonine dehydrogenase-like Zn-dependent dehydrogenase